MDPTSHLEWLGQRRSVRAFAPHPVERAVLERLVAAAITAPSSTNRQPWRFAVVTSPAVRARIVEGVHHRCEEMKAVIRRGHHAEDFGAYGDFFWEPLAAAPVIIVPQYRAYPDMIAQLIESGGGDPTKFHTAGSMQAELCSTSAAVMTLLVQARAEGLGACWMAGPMVGRDEIHAALGIAEPWRMVGAVAVGWPAETPPKQPRKPIDKVVTWFEEGT
jgi:coenzyme F420-0:L-glutamate ligase/coenzyme F420-1:gamma-L-glutamate ligase